MKLGEARRVGSRCCRDVAAEVAVAVAGVAMLAGGVLVVDSGVQG